MHAIAVVGFDDQNLFEHSDKKLCAFKILVSLSDMATVKETQEHITSLMKEKNGLTANSSQMECKFTGTLATLF